MRVKWRDMDRAAEILQDRMIHYADCVSFGRENEEALRLSMLTRDDIEVLLTRELGIEVEPTWKEK
jgi:hypothetical protein